MNLDCHSHLGWDNESTLGEHFLMQFSKVSAIFSQTYLDVPKTGHRTFFLLAI